MSPGCWCALTLRLGPEPFHPSPGPKAVAVYFLLHCPGPSSATRKGDGLGRWALPTTASCGARTFLPPAAGPAKREPGAPGDDRPAGSQTLLSLYRLASLPGGSGLAQFRGVAGPAALLTHSRTPVMVLLPYQGA